MSTEPMSDEEDRLRAEIDRTAYELHVMVNSDCDYPALRALAERMLRLANEACKKFHDGAPPPEPLAGPNGLRIIRGGLAR